MTNNELIKELVTYDGFIYFETASVRYFHREGWTFHYSDLRMYLTDMNILHRIAVKVVSQLKEMYSDDSHDTSFDFEHDMKVTDMKGSVFAAMFKDKNTAGEYIDLATSLVEAIQFVNQHKANG